MSTNLIDLPIAYHWIVAGVVAAIAGALLALGCERRDETPDVSAADVREEAREAGEAASDYMKKQLADLERSVATAEREAKQESTMRRFHGMQVRVVPPEDLIVMKAIVHDEETPRHWADALGILPVTDLDWDYLLLRSQRAPRRMLSFLCYATSVDLAVPQGVLRRLGRTVLYE
jgi:hypothetical protein